MVCVLLAVVALVGVLLVLILVWGLLLAFCCYVLFGVFMLIEDGVGVHCCFLVFRYFDVLNV